LQKEQDAKLKLLFQDKAKLQGELEQEKEESERLRSRLSNQVFLRRQAEENYSSLSVEMREIKKKKDGLEKELIELRNEMAQRMAAMTKKHAQLEKELTTSNNKNEEIKQEAAQNAAIMQKAHKELEKRLDKVKDKNGRLEEEAGCHDAEMKLLKDELNVLWDACYGYRTAVRAYFLYQPEQNKVDYRELLLLGFNKIKEKYENGGASAANAALSLFERNNAIRFRELGSSHERSNVENTSRTSDGFASLGKALDNVVNELGGTNAATIRPRNENSSNDDEPLAEKLRRKRAKTTHDARQSQAEVPKASVDRPIRRIKLRPLVNATPRPRTRSTMGIKAEDEASANISEHPSANLESESNKTMESTSATDVSTGPTTPQTPKSQNHRRSALALRRGRSLRVQTADPGTPDASSYLSPPPTARKPTRRAITNPEPSSPSFF
jgi:DNA repair exonuclease SbcCD ATPase subunit